MDLVVHAGVFAVDVAVGGGRHAGVIEGRGEDAALLVCAALNFDLRELLVPCRAGAGRNLFVRSGGFGFGFEVGAGVGLADVGDADAHADLATLAEADPYAGAVPGLRKAFGAESGASFGASAAGR